MKGSTKGWIYFITNYEDVKIGFTYNISKRLNQLQTANPKKLCLLGFIKKEREFEVSIHSIFKTLCPESHLRGEWFCLAKIYKYLGLFNIDYNKNIPKPINIEFANHKKININYNKKRLEWRKWKNRAKNVGVKPLPARRPTTRERDVWRNLIIQKENYSGTSK